MHPINTCLSVLCVGGKASNDVLCNVCVATQAQKVHNEGITPTEWLIDR